MKVSIIFIVFCILLSSFSGVVFADNSGGELKSIYSNIVEGQIGVDPTFEFQLYFDADLGYSGTEGIYFTDGINVIKNFISVRGSFGLTLQNVNLQKNTKYILVVDEGFLKNRAGIKNARFNVSFTTDGDDSLTPSITPTAIPSKFPTPTLVPGSKTTDQIKIGDYVQFGSYYGEPILWDVIDNSNGIMLASDKILCLKAFDAAESGKDAYAKSFAHGYDMLTDMWGSNDWKKSNIREWLNCADEKVKYSTQPPIQKAVYYGFNAYKYEAGFLFNFTAQERYAIQDVQHDGVIDKMYLLSDMETELLGDTKKKLTKIAVQKNAAEVRLDENKYWEYWTRTPAEMNGFVKFVREDGANIYDRNANRGYIGVVPACNLKSNLSVSGNGSYNSPYIISSTLSGGSEIKLVINNPWMDINGVKTCVDPNNSMVTPVIRNGRTLLPVGSIIEALNGKVSWDGYTNKITITFKGKTIEMWIGNPKMKVDNVEKSIDSNLGTAPELVSGRTMLPIRSIIEETGGKVDWNANMNMITIKY